MLQIHHESLLIFFLSQDKRALERKLSEMEEELKVSNVFECESLVDSLLVRLVTMDDVAYGLFHYRNLHYSVTLVV